jgi:Fe-S oxidoreductase
MEIIEDYFLCGGCQNKDFKRIYNFKIRFHGVNFSEDLIYDKVTEELYQCTNCKRTYTRDQVDSVLNEIKQKRRGKG